MSIRILSGIRASGRLHLGNYLGAIKNWLEFQNNPDLESGTFMIADYHAITTPFDPKQIHQDILDTAIDFLAVGLDPGKVSLIRQSHVPQHTELAWIFNTITPLSWLDRLPTYKEQLEKSSKYNHVGLLDYPVLMAADILIYKANLVPVGDDQLPHIDLANEIARKFNHMFGQTFEPIKPHLSEGARIMSLKDPSKKMSKTADDPIYMSDADDEISQKIKRSVTDSGNELTFDPEKRPAISNLLSIYSLLSGEDKNRLASRYEGKGYASFKSDLAEVIISFVKPIKEKRDEFVRDPAHVNSILTEGEENAIKVASATLKEVKQKIGL